MGCPSPEFLDCNTQAREFPLGRSSLFHGSVPRTVTDTGSDGQTPKKRSCKGFQRVPKLQAGLSFPDSCKMGSYSLEGSWENLLT